MKLKRKSHEQSYGICLTKANNRCRAVLKSRNMFCVQRDSCDLSQRWQAAASEPTWNSRFGASAPRYNACILSQLLGHAECNQ
jgi:hypothetical protein